MPKRPTKRSNPKKLAKAKAAVAKRAPRGSPRTSSAKTRKTNQTRPQTAKKQRTPRKKQVSFSVEAPSPQKTSAAPQKSSGWFFDIVDYYLFSGRHGLF